MPNLYAENLIGKGGYAEVYKGCLKNGQLVAVKQLNKGTADERIASFLSELGTIAHVNHPNIAKLIGCGVEGGMHIVFQLSALGSLGSVLHGGFMPYAMKLSTFLPFFNTICKVFFALVSLSRIKG